MIGTNINETKNKHIYSLNLAAFIIYKTKVRPKWLQDDNGLYYAEFKDCVSVNFAIDQWRQSEVEIEAHAFLNAYKEVREAIKKLRFPEKAAKAIN